MTVAQIWGMIGILATMLLGIVGIVMRSTSYLGKALRVEIGGLRGEMNARFDAVQTQFDHVNDNVRIQFGHVNGRLDRLDGRIDRLDGRIDKVEEHVRDLDRDVHALTIRIIGGGTLGEA